MPGNTATNSAPESLPVGFHQEFADLDSLEAAVSGWKLDFLQLDPGPFQAVITQMRTSRVVISRCRFGRKFLQRGESPPGFRTFGISTGNRFELKWRGHDVDAGNLMVFPPGYSLESVSLPGFDAYAISISEDLLGQFAETRGSGNMESMLPQSDLLAVPASQLKSLRTLARRILNEATNQAADLSDPDFTRMVKQDFVELLLEAMAAGSELGDRWQDSPSRSAGFRRALKIMKDRAKDAIPISEVREQAGVSERTLRYAFNEVYGMPPKTYFHLLRLNRFRLELIRNPDQSVGKLAQRWGFRHMGQFSKDYQKIFGELPSETRSALS